MKSPAEKQTFNIQSGFRSSAREAELLRAEVEELAFRIEQLHAANDRPSQHARSFLKQLLKRRREQLEEISEPRD